MSLLHILFQSVQKCCPKTAHWIKRTIKNERQPWDLSQKEANEFSYYTNHKHKSLSQICKELRYLCQPGKGSWTTPATILHYFMCGLDRIDKNVNDFCFQEAYDKLRNAKQPAFAALLRHKLYTATLLNGQNINISLPLGEITQAGLVVKNGQYTPLKEVLLNDGKVHYFAKAKDGNQGKGTHMVEYENGVFVIDGVKTSDQNAFCILDNHTIEPQIIQHPDLNKIYPHAVASIRIVTISSPSGIDLYARAIKIGSSGGKVSNLGFGGIELGIDKNGVINSRGIQKKPGTTGALEKHPDSKIKLTGFQLPYWKEVEGLAISAHAILKDIHSIGWDIAITPDGPIIIEGNDAWGTMSINRTMGPHNDLIHRYFM